MKVFIESANIVSTVNQHLTERSVNMSISSMKQLVQDAALQDKAVGAFNVGNMEMILAVVTAANELNTPVILQIAQSRLRHSPLYLMGPMMISAARNAHVDIAVQLDHGQTEETVQEALSLGFSSIMFDGSGYEYSKNVSLTSHVATMVRDAGVSMEGELGAIGESREKEDDKIICTDPDLAQEFVQKTGVDALAVAIGNAHGHYVSDPKLQFGVLEEIHNKVDIPLVLHGGTGIHPVDFRKCIYHGVRKINIATSNFDAATRGAENYFKDEEHYNYFGLNEAMVHEVYETVKKLILIFNNQISLEQIFKN